MRLLGHARFQGIQETFCAYRRPKLDVESDSCHFMMDTSGTPQTDFSMLVGLFFVSTKQTLTYDARTPEKVPRAPGKSPSQPGAVRAEEVADPRIPLISQRL